MFKNLTLEDKLKISNRLIQFFFFMMILLAVASVSKLEAFENWDISVLILGIMGIAVFEVLNKWVSNTISYSIEGAVIQTNSSSKKASEIIERCSLYFRKIKLFISTNKIRSPKGI